MCIVTIKPIGREIPNEDLLKTCFMNNPDGCGYMFVRNHSVVIRKGFMNFDSFYADLLEQKLGKKSLIVFHFRITTSGETNQGNTHPFPASDNIQDLISLNIECETGIAHNGILSSKGLDIGEYKLSDTMEFILNTLSDKFLLENIERKAIRNLIEKQIKGSRIVILNKDRTFSILGDGWIEDNGLIHSNNGYKAIKVYFSNWNTKLYSFDSSYASYKGSKETNTIKREETLISEYEHYDDAKYCEDVHDDIQCPLCKNDFGLHNISEFHELYECSLCTTIFDEYMNPIYPMEDFSYMEDAEIICSE